ncbi:MAG: TetR/AcrR family transcriptional regulator, partial [Pseudomonadales bacterium]
MTIRYLDPMHRKRQILDTATELSKHGGLYDFTGKNVADGAGCSRSLVMHHFKSVTKLRHAVIDHAVFNEFYGIVGQAFASKDPYVDGLDQSIRDAALDSLK